LAGGLRIKMPSLLMIFTSCCSPQLATKSEFSSYFSWSYGGLGDGTPFFTNHFRSVSSKVVATTQFQARR
jgi:hypothetical protein